MKPKFLLLLLACSTLFFGSCVSSKKFKASQADVARLKGQVDSLNAKIGDNEKQIQQLQAQNAAASKDAADCKAAKDAMAQQVSKKEAFEKSLAEQGTSIEDIRKRVEEGVSKQENSGATVTSKNGMILVSMPDKLSFREGSSRLSKEGKSSLDAIAQVMNDNPDLTAIVVGNADTLGIKTGFEDNWSLSTERANSIVRILRDKYKVDPVRITSAGRSRYNPIADNSTKEGRKMNRRTDIVLNPDLSKLWDLIDEAAKK